MSIKHYHGLKLPKMPAHELISFFKKVRQDFDDFAKDYYYNKVFDLTVYRLDKAVIDGEAPDIDDPSIFMYYARKIRNWGYEVKTKGERNPWGDYSLEYIIFPLEDKVLAYPFSEQFMDWATEYPGFVDWGWWNNTDRPEGVTEEEWAEREADWDAAYDGYEGRARPVDQGFSFQVHGPVAEWATLDAIHQMTSEGEWELSVNPADFGPTHAKRVKARASEDVIEDHFDGQELEGTALYRAMRAYKKTPEYEAELEARLHTFEALLPEQYPDEAFANTDQWFEENYATARTEE